MQQENAKSTESKQCWRLTFSIPAFHFPRDIIAAIYRSLFASISLPRVVLVLRCYFTSSGCFTSGVIALLIILSLQVHFLLKTLWRLSEFSQIVFATAFCCFVQCQLLFRSSSRLPLRTNFLSSWVLSLALFGGQTDNFCVGRTFEQKLTMAAFCGRSCCNDMAFAGHTRAPADRLPPRPRHRAVSHRLPALGTAGPAPASPLPPGNLIDRREIDMREEVGQGAYGSVCLALYRGRRVACKTFHAGSSQRSYERELRAVYKQLDHRNLVAMLGATASHVSGEGACIVMAFGGCQNLMDYVANPHAKWQLRHALFGTAQVMEGLAYLHSRGLLHLDLKPANCILCPRESVVRLCDFGFIHDVARDPWDSGRVRGSPAFTAPELHCKALPDFTSDLFSLAVTMWCMESRELPYSGLSMDNQTLIRATIEEAMRPLVPRFRAGACRNRFRALYTELWAADPAMRPTLSQAMLTVGNLMLEKKCDQRRVSFDRALCQC